MKLSYSGKSDMGLVRKINQDRWTHVHCDWGDLFVVADGLGHKDGGQFASETTVDTLKERFSAGDPGEIPGFLRGVLQKTNQTIYKEKADTCRNAMMGSTCVVLVIHVED